MAYVDYSYYAGVYYGDDIDESDFPRYNARAQEVIDGLTRYRLVSAGLDNFPALTQELVKKAVCAQIDYYVSNGIDIALAGNTSGGFGIGKLNIYRTGNAGSGKHAMACPQAIALLEQTGLMNPGVALC